VHALLQGIGDALRLIVHGDPQVVATTLRTLRVALEATGIAILIGLPAGSMLGIGRFRGRRVLLALSNGAARLPPVAVGQLVWLLMWPDSRWGGGILGSLGWLYTMNAVIVVQTLLALPIVIALTASAVQQIPAGLLEQAQAYGAPSWRRATLALREARTGVLAAIITAMGVAISAIGAILIVGTSLGDATLATAAVTHWNNGGENADAVAYGTVLLGLFFILAAILTRVQQHRSTWIPGRPS
jgi:tungstate transport system permease protein